MVVGSSRILPMAMGVHFTNPFEFHLFLLAILLLQLGFGGCYSRLYIQWKELPEAFPDDYETFAVRKTGKEFRWEKRTFSIGSPSRDVVGYAAFVTDPSRFHFALPQQGCGHRVKTSDTAEENGCVYATNAGFFNMNTGACIGTLAVQGKEVQLKDMERVVFGLLENQLLIGYVNVDTLKRLPIFEELITGAGWLVRNSKSYVNTSRVKESIEDVFVMERAPRTGLGVLPSGEILILQVDGIEQEKAGVDLYEFAECFRSMNATYAVNLDGGGSSVSWAAGHGVIDHPTCNDTPTKCERAVTSIVCVK